MANGSTALVCIRTGMILIATIVLALPLIRYLSSPQDIESAKAFVARFRGSFRRSNESIAPSELSAGHQLPLRTVNMSFLDNFQSPSAVNNKARLNDYLFTNKGAIYVAPPPKSHSRKPVGVQNLSIPATNTHTTFNNAVSRGGDKSGSTRLSQTITPTDVSKPIAMIKCVNQTRCIQPVLQLKRDYKVYYCKHVSHGVRFYFLAREGLLLHPRLILVPTPEQADVIVYLPESAVWHKTECNKPELRNKLVIDIVPSTLPVLLLCVQSRTFH